MKRQNLVKPEAAIARNDKRLRRFVGYSMKRAYLIIENDLNDILNAHGLRVTTFSGLSIIIDNPDLTQTQLAAALDIERSSCVVVVDALEGMELITRNRVAGDRRTYALRPTLKGLNFMDKLTREVDAHEARLLVHLRPEEKQSLIDILTKIEKAGSTDANPLPEHA